jgi:hypothetical protein
VRSSPDRHYEGEKMIMEMKVKRNVKKSTQYLGDLQSLTMKDPTPQSDEAMIRYLKDSIAWLDSLDEKSV